MKKILLIMLFVTCLLQTKAQVILMVDAEFPKLGIMVHHQTPIPKIGFYQAGMYGKKTKDEFSCETIKLDFGTSYTFGKKMDNLRLYAGINTQTFWNVYDNNPYIDLNQVHKVCFDIGVSRTLDDFTMLIFWDPFNREVSLGLSYWL